MKYTIDELADRIFALLKKHRQLKRRELVAKLGLDYDKEERYVRLAIAKLRKDIKGVGSSTSRGYFKLETLEETDKYIAEARKRAVTELDLVSCAKKYRKKTFGAEQLSLGLNTEGEK